MEENEKLILKNLFELKSGFINFTDIKIKTFSDITYINYNKTDITVICDKWNENSLYISKILNGSNEIISYIKGKSIHSNNAYIFKINENYKEKINIKYIYYYLSLYKDFIKNNFYKGDIIKYLSINKLKEMLIILPSIEKQYNIVKELDYIYEELNINLKKQIEENNKYATIYLESNI
jgi:restriction endonuclease S subunit